MRDCLVGRFEMDALVQQHHLDAVELLQAATERRLMSEVPLGVFLSGGIDSSAVAAMACRLLPPASVETFSIGFEDPSFDESVYAREVAGFLGTRHHEQVIGGTMLLNFVPEVISHLDEPIADGSVVPTALLSRFARERVTVALGGDGGDELFAGYDTFKAHVPAAYVHRWVPRRGIGLLRALAALLPVSQANISLDFQIRQFLRALEYPPETWHSIWLGLVEPRDMQEIFPAGETRPERLYDEVFQLLRDIPRGEAQDSLLAIYSKTYLQMILTKVDRMSMKTSLEVRAPFLDNDVVDYVTGLPFSLKFQHGTSKYILKKALRGILPDSIIDRKKKGFGMPIGRWLQHELQGYMRDLLTTDHLTALGLNAPTIIRMMDEHTRGTKNHRVLLWGLMTLGGMAPGDPRSATGECQRRRNTVAGGGALVWCLASSSTNAAPSRALPRGRKWPQERDQRLARLKISSLPCEHFRERGRLGGGRLMQRTSETGR